MLQVGTNWADGVPGFSQCPVRSGLRLPETVSIIHTDGRILKIPAGTSFQYKFTVANQYGTYWYHSHMGNTMADGLVVSQPPERHAVPRPIIFRVIGSIGDS